MGRQEWEAWLIAQQNVINSPSRLIKVTNWDPFILICSSLALLFPPPRRQMSFTQMHSSTELLFFASCSLLLMPNRKTTNFSCRSRSVFFARRRDDKNYFMYKKGKDERDFNSIFFNLVLILPPSPRRSSSRLGKTDKHLNFGSIQKEVFPLRQDKKFRLPSFVIQWRTE